MTPERALHARQRLLSEAMTQASHGPLNPVFDAATLKSLSRAARLIDADVAVLVSGETGTGKEVFARAAHQKSRRAQRPFVAINCAALPETLIEAELFGYQAGAFTGARPGGSKGHLREADGGVLFLDEIDDMPLFLQTKLLRVLQEREVVPLGATRAVPLDFALICATNRDLRDLVRTGAFRADLYFRIAPYTIALQPLRQREDRAELIDTFWESLGARRGITLSPACRERLAAYEWPGNLRQLAGCLRAMIALCEPGGVLDIDTLPPDLRGPVPEQAPSEAPSRLETIAAAAMQEALQAARGNVSLAARRLGISRSTLYRHMQNGALHTHSPENRANKNGEGREPLSTF